MTRTTVCLLLLLFTLTSLPVFSQASDGQATPQHPNIIIILADDMGYADMGVFGAEGIQTPNLDSVAENGIRFTNFYSPSPVCSPARAGLMTGRHAKRLGMKLVFMADSPDGMDPEEITIAEQLKHAGYQTGMVGKWHLGHLDRYMPWNQGFDEFYGVPYSNDMGNFFWYENQEIIYEAIDQRYLTKRYTDRALDYIERHKDEPFFLYLAHSMPHVPLYVSPEFEGSSERGLYGDVIQELDWSTGEIIKKLQLLNIADNTLVLVSSDNGPWLVMDDHGGSAGVLRSGKASTFEGGQRVPTVAQWPAQIAPGSVSHSVASLLDIMPTVSNIVGVKLPDDRIIDGKDIYPLLKGEEGSVDQKFVYIAAIDAQVQGIRDGDWKLKRAQSGYPEFLDGLLTFGAFRHDTMLFNLSEDQTERVNLAGDYPEQVQRLEQMLQDVEAGFDAERVRPRVMSATSADLKGYGAFLEKGVVLLLIALLGVYLLYKIIRYIVKRIRRVTTS